MPERDWTTGPAKWAAVLVLGGASIAGMAWSIFGKDHSGNPMIRRPRQAAVVPAGPPAEEEDAAPAQGQTGAPPGALPTGELQPSATPAQKVNLNTATAAELQLLPGIGPALAKRIIEYRAEHGRYTSVDQLDNVKGIGPRMMEKLRPLVRID